MPVHFCLINPQSIFKFVWLCQKSPSLADISSVYTVLFREEEVLDSFEKKVVKLFIQSIPCLKWTLSKGFSVLFCFYHSHSLEALRLGQKALVPCSSSQAHSLGIITFQFLSSVFSIYLCVTKCMFILLLNEFSVPGFILLIPSVEDEASVVFRLPVLAPPAHLLSSK